MSASICAFSNERPESARAWLNEWRVIVEKGSYLPRDLSATV